MEIDNSKLVGTGLDGKKYYIDEELVCIGNSIKGTMIIDGIDVMKHKWKNLNQRVGDCSMVEVQSDDKIVRFATREVSQSVFVFFVYKKVNRNKGLLNFFWDSIIKILNHKQKKL